MEKSWRPEDWGTYVEEVVQKKFEIEGRTDWIFYVESGADAMLKAISKMPYCTNPVLLPEGNYHLIPLAP